MYTWVLELIIRSLGLYETNSLSTLLVTVLMCLSGYAALFVAPDEPTMHDCLRLMVGADIYQIAKNCRTSGEMIEKYYAAHIKTNLDAAAINIMRPKPKKKGGA